MVMSRFYPSESYDADNKTMGTNFYYSQYLLISILCRSNNHGAIFFNHMSAH